MNNANRKRLNEAREIIEHAREEFERAKAILDEVKDDEDSKRDNMPESLQETERYQAMSTACDELESATSLAEDLDFGSVIEAIDNASV